MEAGYGWTILALAHHPGSWEPMGFGGSGPVKVLSVPLQVSDFLSDFLYLVTSCYLTHFSNPSFYHS